MHKFLSVVLTLLFCIAIPCTSKAQNNDTINSVLDSAETFFISLKAEEYKTSWMLLTNKSRQTIINDVYKATRKIGGDITRDEINRDFETSGVISVNYWKAFLNTFDPDMILQDSYWEMGIVKKNKAEIIIKHRKSSEPAILVVSKEDDLWKVGLVETFWTRKSL